MTYSVPDIFDLPKDVVLDLPRVTVVGDRQVLVENHRGIVSYTQRLLVVGYSRGRISFRGTDLEISVIRHEEILIEGAIEAVEFQSDEGNCEI